MQWGCCAVSGSFNFNNSSKLQMHHWFTRNIFLHYNNSPDTSVPIHCVSTATQACLMKRIGAGLFLYLVGSLLNLTCTLDTVGHMNSNNTQRMFYTHHTGSASTLPIPLYWPLISDIVIGVGRVLVSCSSIEFIMAQTPNRMRGFMMGTLFTLLGIGYLVQ